MDQSIPVLSSDSSPAVVARALEYESVEAFVRALAQEHSVTYEPTSGDALADTFSRLSDAEYCADSVEDLLLALRRADVLTKEERLHLHVAYLKQGA
jgi:hypothetical protein